jgi:hypothetical protein
VLSADKGENNGQSQNCDQAYNSARDFVNNTTDPFAAIHAIQDSYASGHQYQMWLGGLPSLNHIMGDSVYLPAAEAATEWYLRDLGYNHLQDASAYLHPETCQ